MNLVIWTGSVIRVEPQNTVEPQNKLHLVKRQEDTQEMAFSPAYSDPTLQFNETVLECLIHCRKSSVCNAVEAVELNVVLFISPGIYCFDLDRCYILCCRSLYSCQRGDLFQVPYDKHKWLLAVFFDMVCGYVSNWCQPLQLMHSPVFSCSSAESQNDRFVTF